MSDFIQSIGFAAVGSFVAILIGRMVAGRFSLRIVGTSVVAGMAVVWLVRGVTWMMTRG